LTGDAPSSSFAQRLLEWYQYNRRELPWRSTNDPYRITVAEFMLHQTRVQTVLPYYHHFLERFPNWTSLARASLDDVLKVWEGLGYYARARNLHALAQCVSSQYDGRLPSSREELLALPGIGPYTAGAILSICFGQDEAAIDGNVRRVLCRVFQITEDPRAGAGLRRLRETAAALLPLGQAGTFNQALMDLGATICRPRRPKCGACPLSDQCEARQLGVQESLPVRRALARRPDPHRSTTAARSAWRHVGVPWRQT